MFVHLQRRHHFRRGRPTGGVWSKDPGTAPRPETVARGVGRTCPPSLDLRVGGRARFENARTRRDRQAGSGPKGFSFRDWSTANREIPHPHSPLREDL